MAEKMLKTRIQNKHETEANWLKAINFIPLAGELIVYDVDTEHDTPRFKVGDGVLNVNDLPFVTQESLDLIYYAEDGESLIIDNKKQGNVAGTKAFIIEKAQRITQDDGSYKYYYVLQDGEKEKFETWENVEGAKAVADENGDGVEEPLPTTGEFKVYYSEAIIENGMVGFALNEEMTQVIIITSGFPSDISNEQIAKVKTISFDNGNLTLNLIEDSFLPQFQEVLGNYLENNKTEATNSLRTYYINNSSTLNREYADDYAKTYEVASDGEGHLIVRVDKVKKTYKPVPDSGVPEDKIVNENGEYRYVWKPVYNENTVFNKTYSIAGYTTENNVIDYGVIYDCSSVTFNKVNNTLVLSPSSDNNFILTIHFDGPTMTQEEAEKIDSFILESDNTLTVFFDVEEPSIYEIDYTDTWNYTLPDGTTTTEYSLFRLSADPTLGTIWAPTNSVIVGGSNNKALGKDSFAVGSDNTANGAHSATFGDENYVNYAGIASGRKNKVLEKSGAAFGEKNIVKGYGATAIGGSNEVGGHTYAAAIGQYLKTHNAGEAVLGQYNQATHNKSVALSVGGGSSEATRKDAMTVYRDGETHVLGKVVAAGVDLNAGIKEAKTAATTAKTTADNALSEAGAAKTLANNNAKDIASLETALETANERLTNDIDDLYQETDELKNQTTLQLGELPSQGEVNRLYIIEKDDDVEQYVYKVRKTPKVDKDKVWNGVIATTKPATLAGEGTADDPYLITNGNELSFVVRNTRDKYSKLMNDIYLNDISNPNWKDTANSWIAMSSSLVFNGVFDGQNHTVYGLYYNNPTDSETATSYVGCALFPNINNGFLEDSPIIIKNLGLDYAYVSSFSSAGALIGITQSSNYEVRNCWVGENVELLGTYVASIHTWGNGKALIENCYSLAKANVIEGVTRYPTCVQANWWPFTPTGEGKVTDVYPTFKNCYALNTRLNNATASYVTVENCYCTVAGGRGTVIPKEDMIGINALDNMSSLGEAYVNDYTYPHLTSFAEGWQLTGKTACEITQEDLDDTLNQSNSYTNIETEKVK